MWLSHSRYDTQFSYFNKKDDDVPKPNQVIKEPKPNEITTA